MVVLGTVVRMQVQRSRLKPGAPGERVYDPAPLLQVDALEVGPRGVIGVTPSGPVLDVHHADHPDTRNVKLRNGLSLLPQAHYARMRERYGQHLVDGSAGESLLLETAGPLTPADLEGELQIETADGGLLPLSGAMPAPPCVEFSTFCLGGTADRETIQRTLADLDDGTRGFYVHADGSARIAVGARLLRV